MEVIMRKGKSNERSASLFTGNSITSPVIPNTASILKMLEPTRLPNESSCSPLKEATILAASSGSEVPIETTVIPITLSLTPHAWASSTAPSIKNSDPNLSAATPMAKKKYHSPRFAGFWRFIIKFELGFFVSKRFA